MITLSKGLDMKRVLFIAPAAIPVNGAESIVNFKLLKLLSENGVTIDLVTKKYKTTTYPDEEISLQGVHINSVMVENKINIITLFLHFLTLLCFGVCYKGSHWSLLALSVCKKLIKQNRYDCVITKNYPSELLGWYIKRKYGIKWIATWNDPFPHCKYPHPYGKGPDSQEICCRKRIKQMANADIHIFPNNRLRDYMLSYLNVSLEKTRIIPHICQVHDAPVKPREQCLQLIHSGNLQYPREPWKFLAAFTTFLKEVSDASIHLTFSGQSAPLLQKKVEELGIKEYITILPPESYFDNLKRLQNYDILVIIEADLQEGIFLPTKVGDAMQMKKKIFAVSPRVGVLHDLYENKNIDYFADVSDQTKIYHELCKLYNDYKTNKIWEASLIPAEYQESYVLKQYLSL